MAASAYPIHLELFKASTYRLKMALGQVGLSKVEVCNELGLGCTVVQLNSTASSCRFKGLSATATKSPLVCLIV